MSATEDAGALNTLATLIDAGRKKALCWSNDHNVIGSGLCEIV